jgi:hypothetical protein
MPEMPDDGADLHAVPPSVEEPRPRLWIIWVAIAFVVAAGLLFRWLV